MQLGQLAMAFFWGGLKISVRKDETALNWKKPPPTHTDGSVQGAHVMSE